MRIMHQRVAPELAEEGPRVRGAFGRTEIWSDLVAVLDSANSVREAAAPVSETHLQARKLKIIYVLKPVLGIDNSSNRNLNNFIRKLLNYKNI